MRGSRLLRIMAGLAPTPYEKRIDREMRRLARYANELQARENMMALIKRRERGDGDTKPMPFARLANDGSRVD